MEINEIKEKINICLHICDIEIKKRGNGVSGESSITQLEFINEDLNNLMKILKSELGPSTQERYLTSFANAFRIWGWDMTQPTELFLLLTEINNVYKDL